MSIYDIDTPISAGKKVEKLKQAVDMLKEASKIQFNIAEDDNKQFNHMCIHDIKGSIETIENSIGELEQELERYKEASKFNENIDVNNHRVNANIKAHILTDCEMRKFGFSDNNEKCWYFMRMIKFPKNKLYKGVEISFNVTIPKDGSDINIEILDEAFLQPYDYQSMINDGNAPEAAWIVREQVEFWMYELKRSGIISGHKYGDYI